MKEITERQKDLVAAMEDLAFTQLVGDTCKRYGLPLAPDKPEEIEERDLLKRWVLENTTLKTMKQLDKKITRLAKQMKKDDDCPIDLERAKSVIEKQRKIERERAENQAKNS